jgi:hypothetical protein
MRRVLATAGSRTLWVALLASLALLASAVADKRGSLAGTIFSLEAAAFWMVGSAGLAFSGPRLLTAWRLSAAALTCWSVTLAAHGYLARAAAPTLLAAASYLWSFHPELRTLVGERISQHHERRIPLSTPGLLFLVAVAPASMLTGFTAGIPALAAAGVRPSPISAIVAVTGLLFAIPLVVSTDRMERRWLVIAPKGLVVHDPFLLSATLRIPNEAADCVELGAVNWRGEIDDTSTFLDLTAGSFGTPLLLRLRRCLEAPQPRHTRIGMAFPPGGCVKLLAVCPVFPKGAFASLARAGYARPGEFAKLESSPNQNP